MATKNSGSAAPDIIDGVIRDVFTGSRKSPLTKRGKAPAAPKPSSTAPAEPDGKLVDRIVTYLSSLSSTERDRITSAFAAATARVSDDDTGEQDAAPEEVEQNAAA